MTLEPDDLDRLLGAVDEKWRAVTRRRLAAILAYERKGEGLRVRVGDLCDQAGLTRSAFHALVRRWRASGRDPVSLAPWAKRPTHKSRVGDEAVALLDERIIRMLRDDGQAETEAVVRQALAGWPEEIQKPGLTFARGRVARARADVARRSAYRPLAEPPGPLERRVGASGIFSSLLVDHSAIAVAVDLGDGRVTLPIVTVVLDLHTRIPLGFAVGIDVTPGAVGEALGRAAATVLEAGTALPVPTIVMNTQLAGRWDELVDTLRGAGAILQIRRLQRLAFGGALGRLLGDRLGGYRLVPRLGHRAIDRRVSGRMLPDLPRRTLGQIEGDLEEMVARGLRGLQMVPAEEPDREGQGDHDAVWLRLVALSDTGSGGVDAS